jgi:hypothetical protein
MSNMGNGDRDLEKREWIVLQNLDSLASPHVEYLTTVYAFYTIHNISNLRCDVSDEEL